MVGTPSNLVAPLIIMEEDGENYTTLHFLNCTDGKRNLAVATHKVKAIVKLTDDYTEATSIALPLSLITTIRQYYGVTE